MVIELVKSCVLSPILTEFSREALLALEEHSAKSSDVYYFIALFVIKEAFFSF